MFQRIKEFFFGSGNQAERDSLTQPAGLHQDPIDTFLTHTRQDSPHFFKVMGSLDGVITPQEFTAFCQSFAEGVDYIRQRFGNQPAAIVFTDDVGHKAMSPYYRANNQSIRIPRQFIAQLIERDRNQQGKTNPFILTTNEMASMYAVEEAFHHHDHMRHPERYMALLGDRDIWPGEVGYDEQPLEYEARAIVREAMQEFGITNHAPIATFVSPEDMAWAEPIIKARGDNIPKSRLNTTSLDITTNTATENEPCYSCVH